MLPDNSFKRSASGGGGNSPGITDAFRSLEPCTPAERLIRRN